MNKEALIHKIYEAFRDVKLENGVGLWEAQGHDDRLSAEKCAELREKDEKEDWKKIPIMDLYKCSSSLSFFDAEGLRFHLPIFLLLDLDHFEKEEDELHSEGLVVSCSVPDIVFHLLLGLRYVDPKNSVERGIREHYNERFSLLTNPQIECMVEFLRIRMKEIEEHYNSKYVEQLRNKPSSHRR